MMAIPEYIPGIIQKAAASHKYSPLRMRPCLEKLESSEIEYLGSKLCTTLHTREDQVIVVHIAYTPPEKTQDSVPKELGPYASERYNRRNSFFQHFDTRASLTTEELWRSVTPEMISCMIASEVRRYKECNVIDMFCGSGRDTISFHAYDEVMTIHAAEINDDHYSAACYNVTKHIADAQKITIHKYISDALIFVDNLTIFYMDAPWNGCNPTFNFDDEVLAISDVLRMYPNNSCIIKLPPNLDDDEIRSVYTP